jgi:hypothetical protein
MASDDHDEIRAQFGEALNMTAAELEKSLVARESTGQGHDPLKK